MAEAVEDGGGLGMVAQGLVPMGQRQLAGKLRLPAPASVPDPRDEFGALPGPNSALRVWQIGGLGLKQSIIYRMGRHLAASRKRIGLVGCVKSKMGHAAQARYLYTSPLFTGRRRWVEQSCECWFVLSAKYGLVAPEQVLEPYDQTLTRMSRAERRTWAGAAVAALRNQLHDLRTCTFEIHAGAAYFDFGLRDGLVADGAAVEIPSQHLGLGEQLALHRTGPPPNG